MAEAIESTIDLPSLPVMVAVARAHIAYVLDDTPRVHDAQLITSELVTNAVTRGTASFTITGRLHGYRARIEVEFRVTDDAPGVDVGEVGPGLGLVALLADEMGDEHTDGITTMWAELAWSHPTDTREATT
ncbi:ATP-binding protein [Embleya sp. NPDC059259]|uniref:ATP-binding protein n=1 Tax=unclassified Embleya TaxID=2699296 RepID=UPI0036C4BF43